MGNEPTADMETTNDVIRPVGDGERIVTLDVLRGLAIFGILFVNIGMYSFPEGYSQIHQELFGGTADRIVHLATQFFIEGKFYSLFSVLFGVGAAIQFERARQRGRRFGPWYARRLLVLLGIGLVHDVFIASGIILITYSIVGFWLIPFFKRRTKTLLIWACITILIPVVVVSVFITVKAATESEQEADPAATASKTEAEETADKRESFEEDVATFADGRYLDLVRVRIGKLAQSVGITFALGTYVLGMFLIGVLLWRSGWITEPQRHRAELKRLLTWGLVVGGLCTGGFLTIRALVTSAPPPIVLVPGVTMQLIGNMALCLGYLAAVVLAMTTRCGFRLLSPLAPVGRTALSNYIFQSLVCTTIFYGHGLGLYGRVGPTANLLLVFAVFSVQLALSSWWVRRFRFGPVEWVWRSLTYGRRFPIMRDAD